MIRQQPYILLLQDYLVPYFEHKRYMLQKDNLHFKRTTSFGHASVICNVVESEVGRCVTFFLGIRHSLIENTLQGLAGNSPYFQNESHTLLVNWRHLIATPGSPLPPPLFVSSDNDLEDVGNSFIDFMDRKGFFFLEKFRALSAIDALYNGRIEKAAVWSNNHYLMSFRGMLTALVLHREDAHLVYSRHKEYLERRGFSGEITRKFDAIYSHLSELSLN